MPSETSGISEISEAFALAERARVAIAEIVDAVETRQVDLTGAFAMGDSDPLMGRIFAVKVFEVVPGIGKVRARRTMDAIGLAEDIWLQDVPADKRVQIMSEFRDSITFVLSGPGGVGKGTVVARLLDTMDNLWLSRSWTTREIRPGEAPDAYNFVDRATFLAHVENDGFLEWVEFLDYLQGTPKPTPPAGNDVLLEIDVQGAAQIKKMNPDAVLLFLDSPSVEEQERRLRLRGDSNDRVAQRLETAVAERAAAAELGCRVVINDELDATVTELASIIDEHRS